MLLVVAAGVASAVLLLLLLTEWPLTALGSGPETSDLPHAATACAHSR
ncbi:MAG: hypothetical protein ACRDO2_02635 [Nocardioidaceae bacterium]